MEENRITIINEDGKEKEMEIFFTYFSEQYGKNYVFFYDPAEGDDGETYCMSFDEQENLFEIEDEEEWNAVREVFEDYINEKQEQE